ncbi:hypothetical protein pb186bvf_014357 [Paramecium bursaria]
MHQAHGPCLELHNIKQLERMQSESPDPQVASFIDQQETQLPKRRKDKFQKSIQKGSKYQITFRDQILPELGLLDIKIVENWKKLNQPNNDEETACSGVKCLLF